MDTNADRDLLNALRASLGDKVVVDRGELAFYGTDRCHGGWSITPSAVVFPASVADVQAVVRICSERKAAIVPSGGRTGLAGGAAATRGEVVLSLDRMRQILAIDRAAAVVRCQAGATVESVQIAAAEAGLFYPIDFAAKGSAHIGGSIATNAGGVRVLRYGTTRSWVAGLSVVLASGEVLNVGGPLLKDNTGYDLRHLFIGSEGTLGVIVEATLRLCAPPNEAVVACCGVEDLDDIIALLQRLRSSFALQAFECFDAGCLSYVHRHHGKGRSAGPFEAPYYALVEVEVPGHGDPQREFESLADELVAAEQAGEIVEATIATSAAQARELWALREDISEALHRHRPHKSDVSIPIGSIPAFVAAWRAQVMAAISGAEPLVFGHIGDSNLHLNVVPAPQTATDVFVAAARSLDEATYVLVGRYEGSISAEHGIGLLKRDYLHHSRSANELAIMKAIKHQLDPDGLFNPGKLLGA